MIVCDRFVFIHLHKSGGTFVNQLLLQCVPSARQLGYHLPYPVLPAAYRDLPVLGTVRNPWEYYVSWFFFQSAQPNPNALFRICSEDRALDFAGTIRNLVTLSDAPQRRAELRNSLPDDFRGAGLNLTKTCVDDLAAGQGFYSFLYNRMYRGADNLLVLCAEQLRAELRGALERFGVLPNPRAELFLAQAPRMNTSRHGPYRDYYDPELRDRIADADRDVIARFGYRF